jgi:hypothetical protein
MPGIGNPSDSSVPALSWPDGNDTWWQGNGSPWIDPQQSGDIANAPPVPSSDGTPVAGLKVSTPSIDLFSKNVDLLVGPAGNVANALLGLPPIAPGYFADGDSLYTAHAKLVTNFTTVFQNLGKGLEYIRDNAQAMSQKYKTTEDLASADATDVQNFFAQSSSAFGPITGGSGPGGAGGAGGTGGQGSGGSGSGGSGGNSGSGSGGASASGGGSGSGSSSSK